MRQPVVSGQFYPADPGTLSRDLDTMVPSNVGKINAVGAVVPHAGYMYSGAVAGEVYARLMPKATYVVLSPNHTGNGARFSASPESWMTPLGEVELDVELLENIAGNTALIEEDRVAHAREHSIEVQLPFIQKISKGSKVVPITVSWGNVEECAQLAGAITVAIAATGRNTMVIASSDMTHYESRALAGEKDAEAIEAVLELDAGKLLKVVEARNITMCGCVPTAIMLMCAKGMGAHKAELIKYADSGEVTGDTDEVVGYAGIVVS
ncbi:MAG: AmmeMemoRadiSam system protein B [Candidatus Tantalella remota]|nr:AmmeMemoRadiSam system protein B [Candidatus Tantalella remota]